MIDMIFPVKVGIHIDTSNLKLLNLVIVREPLVVAREVGKEDETADYFENSIFFILDSFSFNLLDLNQFAIISRAFNAAWIKDLVISSLIMQVLY